MRHEKAWRLAKKATVNPHPIDQQALIKLLIDGVSKEGRIVRARFWNQWDTTKKFAEKFGSTAARYISDIARAQEHAEAIAERERQIIQDASERAARIVKDAEQSMPELWNQLCSVLGLPEGSNIWKIRDEIARLRTHNAAGPHQIRLIRLVDQLRRLVELYSVNHDENC